MVLIVVTEILNIVTLKERFGAFTYIHLQVEKGKWGEPALVSPLAKASLNPASFSVPPENGGKDNLRNITVFFF